VLAAALGVADDPVLGAVEAPAPEQAASAIDASKTSALKRLGVVITRWSSSWPPLGPADLGRTDPCS
jgi:hypothetical protein